MYAEHEGDLGFMWMWKEHDLTIGENVTNVVRYVLTDLKHPEEGALTFRRMWPEHDLTIAPKCVTICRGDGVYPTWFFGGFFPVGHITFQVLLLVKSSELRQTGIWRQAVERILYTMVTLLSVESDRSMI